MKFDPKERREVKTFKRLMPGPEGEYEVRYIPALGAVLPYAEELEFDVRPFPYSELPIQRGSMNLLDVQKKEFQYCLVGWRGLTNGEGHPLPCDEETKDAIFDFHKGIRDEVLDIIESLHVSTGTAIKN